MRQTPQCCGRRRNGMKVDESIKRPAWRTEEYLQIANFYLNLEPGEGIDGFSAIENQLKDLSEKHYHNFRDEHNCLLFQIDQLVLEPRVEDKYYELEIRQIIGARKFLSRYAEDNDHTDLSTFTKLGKRRQIENAKAFYDCFRHTKRDWGTLNRLLDDVEYMRRIALSPSTIRMLYRAMAPLPIFEKLLAVRPELVQKASARGLEPGSPGGRMSGDLIELLSRHGHFSIRRDDRAMPLHHGLWTVKHHAIGNDVCD